MQGILREKNSPMRRKGSIGHVTFEDDPPSPRKPILKRKESGLFVPLNSSTSHNNFDASSYTPYSYIIFENSEEESDY